MRLRIGGSKTKPYFLQQFKENGGRKKLRRRKHDLEEPVTVDWSGASSRAVKGGIEPIEPPHSTTTSGAANGYDFFDFL